MDRSSQIIRTSWIGIIANVLLAAFKAGVGLLASSVAIVMDAVNNLSDALSSVITIIGTKLSQRPADRKHPFGFGRIEGSYLAHRVGQEDIQSHRANLYHHDSHSHHRGDCGKVGVGSVCQEPRRKAQERCPDSVGL